MRPKSLLLLLLALGCGLVASIGISQVMEHRNQGQAPAAETEKIFVAKKDIRINEPLNPQNINLEDWPKEKVPADAIRDLKELENQKAGGTILAGEPIRKGKFANDTRTEEIPDGYRVVAVPADAVSATGHLLQPGDRVDVIVYLNRNTQSGIDQPTVKTVLQDVRVFAINEHWRPSEGNNAETIAARTVSLLVTPEQMELVTLAAEMGRIRLALRNASDEKLAQTPGKAAADLLNQGESSDRSKEWADNKNQEKSPESSNLLDLLNGKKEPPAPPVVAAAPPAPVEHVETFTMELMKGDQISRVEFTKTGKEGRWKTDTTGGGSFQTADPTVSVDPSEVMPGATSPLPPTSSDSGDTSSNN